MNVSLTPALEEKIQEKLALGFYNSASEIIREALRLLFAKDSIPQERLDMLKKDIEEGLNDMDKGRYEDGHVVMKRLIAKYE